MTDLQPHLNPQDKELLYRYLDKATVYLEFGSGYSTYQAALRSNISKIYSIESDPEWYRRIKELCDGVCNKVTLYLYDLKPQPGMFGNPGPNSDRAEWKRYTDSVYTIQDIDKVDTVLIDGRFRVAAAYKLYALINDECNVLVNDFGNRPHYMEILRYYNIIDRNGGNMVVMRKKTGIDPPSASEISKYEYDQR